MSAVPIPAANVLPSQVPHPQSQIHSLQIRNDVPYNTAIPYNHHQIPNQVPGLPGQLRKASSAAALADKETNTEFYRMAHGGARTKDYRGAGNHLRVPSVTRSKTFSVNPHSQQHMFPSGKVSFLNVNALFE